MDRWLILLACLLSALLATALSLTCLECHGDDEKSCAGAPKQCPVTADACVATYDLSSDGKTEVRHYRRYCGSRQNCSLMGSFSSSGGTIKIASSCCFTSNCAPSMPSLPTVKPEKNGVSCMDCQGTIDKPCASSTYRACTGDETKCVAVTQLEDKSLSGCGTPGLCGAKVPDRTMEQPMQFLCTSAGGALQSSLITLLLASSVMLVRIIG